jgi:hypothetical protein
MSPMVSQASLPTPLLVSEKRAQTAKASLRKADTDAFYASLGACMEEVRCVHGLTLEQFAHELGKDQRQVARQIAGTERPQLEAVFAIDRFRAPLVIALAKLSAGVEVVTEIRVRRSA